MHSFVGRRLRPAVPWLLLAVLVLAASSHFKSYPVEPQGKKAMSDIRFMTLEPGHFHAALVQKEMYPGVSARVDI